MDSTLILKEEPVSHLEMKPASSGELKSLYACNTCNNAHPQKHVLKRHMNIHLPVKRFACDDCGKTFIQKNDLRHVKTHSKTYNCDQCGNAFSRMFLSLKHKKIYKSTKHRNTQMSAKQQKCYQHNVLINRLGNLFSVCAPHTTKESCSYQNVVQIYNVIYFIIF